MKSLAVVGSAMALLGAILLAALFAEGVASKAADGKCRHVVLLKLKDDRTADKLQEIETALTALKKAVPEIVDLEWGPEAGVEKSGQGFTHCLVITFSNTADRDAFLLHDARRDFIKQWEGDVEKSLVVDFVPCKF